MWRLTRKSKADKAKDRVPPALSGPDVLTISDGERTYIPVDESGEQVAALELVNRTVVAVSVWPQEASARLRRSVALAVAFVALPIAVLGVASVQWNVRFVDPKWSPILVVGGIYAAAVFVFAGFAWRRKQQAPDILFWRTLRVVSVGLLMALSTLIVSFAAAGADTPGKRFDTSVSRVVGVLFFIAWVTGTIGAVLSSRGLKGRAYSGVMVLLVPVLALFAVGAVESALGSDADAAIGADPVAVALALLLLVLQALAGNQAIGRNLVDAQIVVVQPPGPVYEIPSSAPSSGNGRAGVLMAAMGVALGMAGGIFLRRTAGRRG